LEKLVRIWVEIRGIFNEMEPMSPEQCPGTKNFWVEIFMRHADARNMGTVPTENSGWRKEKIHRAGRDAGNEGVHVENFWI